MAAMILQKHMDELLTTHRMLLDTAERKRQAILDRNVSEMTLSFQQELRLFEHIEEAQAAWRSYAADLMATRGIRSETETTFERVAELLPTHMRDEVVQFQDRLRELVEAIKSSNSRNQQLIQRSLEYIDFMVELYQDDEEQSYMYQNPAAEHHSTARDRANRFESRA